MNLRSLPKIDLHRHLEGSVRFDTFRELAREVGVDLTARELRRRTSMRGEKPGFRTFLSKFELYRGLYPSREWIERVACEAAEDARRDGVVYLELRFSPAHFARRMKAKGEDVASWVARGVRRSGLATGFIATFGRDFSPEENGPTARAVLGTDLFCGLDVAGDESKSALPFLRLFRRTGLPVTLHAGEFGGAVRVREAIERFGARRIGHGVRVLEDEDVLALARSRDVTFEGCLTSELQTGAAKSLKRHPLLRMRDAGLRLSLCTDDPSISGITMTGEVRTARRAGFTMGDLKRAQLDGVRASFASSSVKARVRREIEAAWPGDGPYNPGRP